MAKQQKTSKTPTASQVARKVEVFQQKREKAQSQITALQQKLEQIDERLKQFLRDVPVCV